jgi:ribosomal subunit interface protein
MAVRITARHCDPGRELRQHVETRSQQLERFFEKIIDQHWVLERDGRRYTSEAAVKVHGAVLTGRGEGADLRTAVDQAANHMEAQLKKYKSRLKEKNHRAISEAKTAGSPLDEEATGD